MNVYHRSPAGAAIIRDGFRDGEGSYMTPKLWRGVWVSDTPLDENEGAKGDDVVVVDIPAAVFKRYEWVEEGETADGEYVAASFGYREALIPARVVNRYPRRLVDGDEL